MPKTLINVIQGFKSSVKLRIRFLAEAVWKSYNSIWGQNYVKYVAI